MQSLQLQIPSYISIALDVVILVSILLLILTRPDRQPTRDQTEIAPDAKYHISIQKALLTACVAAGATSSILLLALGKHTVHRGAWQTSLTLASNSFSWGYLALLSLLLILSTRYHASFTLICHFAVVATVRLGLSAVMLSDDIYPLTGRASFGRISTDLEVDLNLLSTLAAGSALVVAINIPRAPKMEYNDKLVVELAWGSIWNQLFFVYSENVQRIAREKSTIAQDDLETVPYEYRSAQLHKEFSQTRGRYTFLRRLWTTFKIPLLLQWSGAIIAAFLMYAPAFFLLRILDFIESYKKDKAHEREISIYTGLGYVAGMFVTQQFGAFLESQLWFISAAVLQVQTRAAINLDIYEKTLRRQNTLGNIEKSDKDDDSSADEQRGDEHESAVPSTKQNVMNLMTVDADRISTFFVWNFFCIQSPVELIISLVFLYKLVGWATIPGFGVMCLFIPITTSVSKIYATTQDKLMAARDRRVGLINEILQGIRQIKFQSNESYFMKKAQEIRDQELHQLSISYFAYIGIDFCYALAPVAITVVTFGVYAKFIADLTPSIAFTSLVIMNQMRFSLNFIPEVIVELISTWTSVKRIDTFLGTAEVDSSILEGSLRDTQVRPIRLDNVSLAFAGSENDEDSFRLRGITVEFPLGALSLISGSTGSGKSLLLTGLLGEARLLDGKLDVPRSVVQEAEVKYIPPESWVLSNTIAYVAQTAWLENKSIQDNILFGSPLDRARYHKTLEVCGLSADLQVLEDGDQTEIGEKGINLSGGQKARVSLARAVYSRASIVIMDDVLSALDAHIAKHVFDKCINGSLMNGRTRILVTHQISLCLESAQYVVALENGTVKHAGMVKDLRRTGSLEHIVQELDTKEESDLKDVAQQEVVVSESSGTQKDGIQARTSTEETKQPRKLVNEENKFEGNVTFKVYLRYLRSQGSPIFSLTIILLFVLELTLSTFGSYWIRIWSSVGTGEPSLTILRHRHNSAAVLPSALFEIGTDHSMGFWVGFYLLIMVGSQAAVLSGTALIFWGAVHAGRKIYAQMLDTIMRAPLRFLDTVPTGRLLNRFSKDAESIDAKVANNIAQFCKSSISLIFILIVCVTVQPIFIIAAFLLIAFGLWIGLQYVSSTRALKRLDSVNRSPMYDSFSTTIAGITTIRAYGSSQRFLYGMFQKIDNVTTAQFYNMVVNRWLSLRFESVGNIYTVGMAIVILLRIDTIDSGLAGFTLSFALEFQQALLWTIRYFAEMEMAMNAAERMFEYTDITTEANHESAPGRAPPAAWPMQGSIEFRDLELKYAPELPSVLHRISFKINPHEKIGIIGRTGSGKTTITLALFRFLEAHHGSISIDGINIASMGLHDLRSRLTIVPQEPTLFQGTIRSNLSDTATDDELFDALKRVHLITEHASGTATPISAVTTNKNVFENLDSIVTEAGSNFSAGQRQLICLARALLRRNKIIVMDEATSSIGYETDALIQETIRSEFTDCTVLTIAHRLDTIIDYDRILVLGQGHILELGTPENLLKDDSSQFSRMVKAANLMPKR